MHVRDDIVAKKLDSLSLGTSPDLSKINLQLQTIVSNQNKILNSLLSIDLNLVNQNLLKIDKSINNLNSSSSEYSQVASGVKFLTPGLDYNIILYHVGGKTWTSRFSYGNSGGIEGYVYIFISKYLTDTTIKKHIKMTEPVMTVGNKYVTDDGSVTYQILYAELATTSLMDKVNHIYSCWPEDNRQDSFMSTNTHYVQDSEITSTYRFNHL